MGVLELCKGKPHTGQGISIQAGRKTQTKGTLTASCAVTKLE